MATLMFQIVCPPSGGPSTPKLIISLSFSFSDIYEHTNIFAQKRTSPLNERYTGVIKGDALKHSLVKVKMEHCPFISDHVETFHSFRMYSSSIHLKRKGLKNYSNKNV